MNIDPLTLTSQLRALTKVGATSGDDGSAAINEASPDVRLALNNMIQDADRMAQHYADVASGMPTAESDVTPIVNTYTGALVACTKAGFRPKWFDPNELTSS